MPSFLSLIAYSKLWIVDVRQELSIFTLVLYLIRLITTVCFTSYRVLVVGCCLFLENSSSSSSVDVVITIRQRNALGHYCFFLYTIEIFDMVNNEMPNYDDDPSLLTVANSPTDRLSLAESLNRDLAAINRWCSAWNMKLNGSKTMIVGKSRTSLPAHSSLVVHGVPLTGHGSLMILGVEFFMKLMFEPHLHSLVSSVSHKLGIVRKRLVAFGAKMFR